MYNKDYIMRMIEQLVAGIARIMGLKQENRLDESAELLTDTLRTFYGLNGQSVDMLPMEDLMAVASFGGLPDAERCALLAQLVKEKADLDGLRGNRDQAVTLYIKALGIYLSALLSDPDYNTAEHREHIGELIELTTGYALPQETRRQLFRYHELTGNYAKAEDALYRLLEGEERQVETAEEGRTFYQRLLQKSNDDLIRGNLPRIEVQDGLRRLESLKL